MNTPLECRIQSHPFFHGMNEAHLALLVKGASEKGYEVGELLCREGQPANAFFLIESGAVALEVHEPGNGSALVKTIRAGEVLGWSWLFPPFTWHLRARVVEPVTAVVLSGAHLLSVAEANHDFGYELMKRVAQVVVRRLQAARKQLLDHGGGSNSEGP